MAELRFLVQQRERLVEPGPRTAYLCGLDLNPWNVEWSILDDGFRLEFVDEDSPRLVVRIRREGAVGESSGSGPASGSDVGLALSTATLQPREQPYVLWVELARGLIDRLRNRVAHWSCQGFSPSSHLSEQVNRCSRRFCDCLLQTRQLAECERIAIETLELGLATISLAVGEYLSWLERTFESDSAPHQTLRGTWLPESPSSGELDSLESLVNTMVVRPNWRELEPSPGQWNWSSLDAAIEQANSRHFNVVLGPIIEFRRSAFPEWLFAIDDPGGARRAVQRYVVELMERYSPQIDLCLLASGINLACDTGWDGATRLQLLFDAAGSLRRSVDNLPFVMGVRQPFGESQPRGCDYPALHMADALLRGNVELCGFALEIDFGEDEGAGETWSRDFTQLIDRLSQWSMFGLPLLICTSARHDQGLGAPGAGLGFDLPHWLRWLDTSPVVHAVFWSEAVDREGEGRGLLAADGTLTPAADWVLEGFQLSGGQETRPH